MNVSNVQTSVNLWAMQQAMAMQQVQALAPVTQGIVNNLAALQSGVGVNLDVRM
ncbi:hypothetical protein OS242_10795 [Tumebacillus sp. DT12]|uniref:Motility protein n=1 Tax=Tumebacillus lacus TaxID=2995335 RepID=A0ABT3X0M5_9BACL|nr:hypothetical protein [Tumebacillus lacus]MCX7570449.1 hypothetical protein [Tumebacillus lacus]